MSDIANKAGVAVSTVSSALHDTGRIGDEQRKRIKDLARELGYRPKLAAQLLPSSRSGRLALLIPTSNPVFTLQSGFAGPIIAEFIYQCTNNGKGYHIEFINQDKQNIELPYTGPDAFTSGLSDGALVIGYVENDVVRKWLHDNQEQYPYVSLQEPGPMSVSTDYAGGIYQAARHLYEMGHRKIAYMSTKSHYRVHVESLKGFKRAVEDFSLDTHDGKWIKLIGVQPHYQDWVRDHSKNAKTLLKASNRPTAIISHDVICARTTIYAAMELGLHVPEDVSVITSGSVYGAEKAPPLLSTVEPDSSSIVREAINLLNTSLMGEPVTRTNIIVDEKLFQGESVRSLTV
tara:strand:- start:7689 stop:8726 length:1038 start_codon:yes stop_codon:yes gene_type:complete